MQGSYLNLVIRANSVELRDSGASSGSVVHSVKIDKGDVETALKECYIFLNENRDLQILETTTSFAGLKSIVVRNESSPCKKICVRTCWRVSWPKILPKHLKI